MSYLDEAGLARYDGLLKDLALRDGADPSLLNWQKTAAAGAVSFLPVPEMPLDPVVNFLFTETGPASGTKSPDNPSTITGVTQAKVTRCGKNVLPTTEVRSLSPDAVSVAVDSDGGVVINGSTSDLILYIPYFNDTYNAQKFPDFIKKGLTYTIFLDCADSNVYAQVYANSGSGWGGPIVQIANNSSSAFTVSNETTGLIIRLNLKANQTFTNVKAKLQIELGSTATSFEKYEGNVYTIPLNGTYYGGSVDLGTGVMTVTKRAFRIGDYQDTITYNSENNRWQVIVRPRAEYTVNPVCSNSIFDQSTLWTTATEGVFRWAAGGPGTWWWFRSEARTLEDFLSIYGNSYIVYTLYEPQIVSLTPTQIYSLSQLDPYIPRTNTVYSDQVSVQVGYPKSPQATQNELTSAIVSLGGNV